MSSKVTIGMDMPEDKNRNELIAKQFGMSSIQLSNVHVPRYVLQCLSAEVARRYKVLPVSKTEAGITVALGDPMDFDTLDSLRYLLKQNIEGVYCNPKDLAEAINLNYGDET
jgi:type IV pilus assembly protein PilB